MSNNTVSDPLAEGFKLGRARMNLVQMRDGVVIAEREAWNVITKAQIDFMFQQSYKTSGLAASGLNYIALSNSSLTEDSTSTTLSGEISSNGLSRAQGTVAHTNGTSTLTVTKTFTATGAQSCQKAALFNASSSGDMGHALSFTSVTLATNDTLAVTFTITLS